MINDPRTWPTVWGLTVGVGVGSMGGGGQREKNWDSCNRTTISNDLIKKKINWGLATTRNFLFFLFSLLLFSSMVDRCLPCCKNGNYWKTLESYHERIFLNRNCLPWFCKIQVQALIDLFGSWIYSWATHCGREQETVWLRFSSVDRKVDLSLDKMIEGILYLWKKETTASTKMTQLASPDFLRQ